MTPHRGLLFAGLQPARERGGNDDGIGGVLAVELDFPDAGPAFLDLFRRDENLPHVFVGLAEVLLQFQHPLVQAYLKLLVWDIEKQPPVTRITERLLNPVLGKSLVVYAQKPIETTVEPELEVLGATA